MKAAGRVIEAQGHIGIGETEVSCTFSPSAGGGAFYEWPEIQAQPALLIG